MIATISTQHQDSDHVDGVGLGAKLAEVKKSLLRNDRTDQEGDQHHDRDGQPADFV
jgi:hypothetical protein